MLVVRTYVASSRIHGLGVFASAPVAAGTLVWRFNPVIDQIITTDEIRALPVPVQEIVLSRAFVGEDGQTILSRDNGVFLNHSDRPNIAGGLDGGFAIRDIAQDEEITEDYRMLPPGGCQSFLATEKCVSTAKVFRLRTPARSLFRAFFEELRRKHECRSR